jgi:hypothetical protein
VIATIVTRWLVGQLSRVARIDRVVIGAGGTWWSV